MRNARRNKDEHSHIGRGVYAVLVLAFLLVGVYVGMRVGDREIAFGQTARVRSEAFFTAFDITSATFEFCDSGGAEAGQVCTTGSAAEDGWLAVSNEPAKSVQVEIDTINGTSLEFIIEARLEDATGNAQIWPATGDRSETATGSFIVQVPDAVNQMRVGIKVTGDSGAQDVTATLNTYSGAR